MRPREQAVSPPHGPGDARFVASLNPTVLVLLEHEEEVWVPLQEVGVELLGGLDGLAHSPRQHQLLDLCKPTGSVLET